MPAQTPISAADAINPAFQYAKQQLFEPFRFAQWVRLAFVGLLAGEMGSGGGCNSGVHPDPIHHHVGAAPFLGPGFPWHLAHHHPALPAGLIVFLLVSGFVLFLLFTYINSVMRFILFDSIVAKQCHIRQGWVRNTGRGVRLFVWQILLAFAVFSTFFVLVGVPVAGAFSAGWFTHPREHVLSLVLGGVGLFILLVVFVAVLAVVHVLTKDFVVPQMALENIGAIEGWQRLWSWLKAEKLNYAGYIGMKVVMAIGASIALGIFTLFVALMLLVPIGGIGVGAVLAAKAAGWTWNFHTIALAVVAGAIALLIFMFGVSLISVPIIVFFPAYSVYFLAPRYAPLASVLWPQPASSSPGAPPLSPA
jgi:hypothetical protein